MPDIQNEVNKMFEQRREQERFADNIVGQRNDQFENFLKQQQKNQELTNSIVSQRSEQFEDFLKQQQERQQEIIKQQEIAYQNSIYYRNYQILLNSLEQNIITIYYEILQNYQKNNTIYKNSYYEKVTSNKIISGIGYPVPKKYLNELKQIVKDKLTEISVIEDGEFEADIIPAKYVRDSNNNIMKKVDSYILEVSLNKKMNKNKTK